MTEQTDQQADPAPATDLVEFGRRQNPYFLRDSLPHPLEVKAFWLGLQGAPAGLSLDDVGLSVFSQNNEDGILLYLFSRIGFGSRRSIEIGCNIDNTTLGVPEGNSINLIVNFGFHGLILDMEPANIAGMNHFFASCLTTAHYHQAQDVGGGRYSPVLREAEVTVDNINDLFRESGFSGEIDLLSVDVDGNDVHLIEAVRTVSPRVLVVEVNSRLPFEQSLWGGATPDWSLEPASTAFRRSAGSSLTKMCEVVEARGYVCVGFNSILINAFFMRADAFAASGLTRVSVADVAAHRLRPPESFLP